MACATISLKRSLDFDPLSPRRPKRRRCNPLALTSLSKTSPITVAKPQSAFQEATPSLSKEELAASIRTEIRRLRRKKTKMEATVHTSSSQSDSSDGEQLPTASSSMTCAPQAACSTAQQKKDSTPLFTFKQMTILCERMIKERTETLCEEYDKVLASKLAEQYEAFLKFNHDQIQQHFSNSSDASYLS